MANKKNQNIIGFLAIIWLGLVWLALRYSLLGVAICVFICLVMFFFRESRFRPFMFWGLVLLGLSPIVLGDELSSTLVSYVQEHERYFGFSNYENALFNITATYHQWQGITYLQYVILPSVLIGIWSYIATAIIMKIVETKTPEQKLMEESRKRKAHHATKANFSAIRKNGYRVPDVPLGVNLWERSGKKPVYLPGDMLNKHVCLVGTTGSGKTVTLYNFVQSALALGKAVVFVDGKGDPGNVAKFRTTCAMYGRTPEIITLDGSRGYNPFATGTSTELMDKLISMFDWSEEHYRLGASRFVQLLIQYLQLEKMPVTLSTIVKYCDLATLRNYHIAQHSGRIAEPTPTEAAPNVMPSFDAPSFTAPTTNKPITVPTKQDEIIELIGGVDKKSISGIRDRIATLAEGDMSAMFSNPNAVNLSALIEAGGCVLFSVDSLRYPQQSKAIGRLVVNDVKNSVSNHARNGSKPVGLFFDEFNVFASHEVVDVINKSRSAGYEALLSFQSLADIDKLESGEALRRQIIQNCNSLIVQRQNDSKDAEELASLFGTYQTTETTYQKDMDGQAGAGSVRQVHEFRVHPDDIKNLGVGQAFLRVAGGVVAKIHVLPN